jgi:hypothetical protein
MDETVSGSLAADKSLLSTQVKSSPSVEVLKPASGANFRAFSDVRTSPAAADYQDHAHCCQHGTEWCGKSRYTGFAVSIPLIDYQISRLHICALRIGAQLL